MAKKLWKHIERVSVAPIEKNMVKSLKWLHRMKRRIEYPSQKSDKMEDRLIVKGRGKPEKLLAKPLKKVNSKWLQFLKAWFMTKHNGIT